MINMPNMDNMAVPYPKVIYRFYIIIMIGGISMHL